jgi:hypothetical protein
MKKIITFFAFVAISTSTSAQTKDTFILKNIPTYDQFGNLYIVTKSFDHIPTSQDTLNFDKESKIQVNLLMDSVKKYYAPTPIRKKSKKK